ncbi:hypothetical protein ACRRTK_004289 [Alexandromys fortis]
MGVAVSPGAVARSELPERHGKVQPGAARWVLGFECCFGVDCWWPVSPRPARCHAPAGAAGAPAMLFWHTQPEHYNQHNSGSYLR